ncbi:hypothetical protein [Colwellia psychrerythraea]|uniref:Uncharacterized protein n=1 Tax=Colwellia psychrerythraea TaxID=28229 RepID=A0A099L6T3_COLPS|nr:hypothetical protein [Colwellia psychrerythraea]KGJ97593.1 hypothetical protein GAB14E_1182 [Colwellia psychrerythraea]
MLKGTYTTIIVSVLLHLILLFALTYGSINPPKVIKRDKPKVTSIKSFLYSAPKKTIAKKSVPKIITTEQVIAEIKPPKKTAAKQVVPKKEIITKPTNDSQPKVTAKVASTKVVSEPAIAPIIKPPPAQVTNAVKSDTVTTKNKVAGASRGGFSSYDRLSRLRNKLANQQRDQAFVELTQKRSASGMDGDPFPVPKTLVPLTIDQQYKLNTSQSHVGSITKNDNGTCTIHREQILGSPVEASTSYFACGESKFDKSFRQHMQKVQAKLPIRR